MIDTNHNQTIDYTEFIAATMNRSNLLEKNNLTKAFALFDIDGNGYISRDEIIACLGILSEDISSIFETIDENKDGFIDFEEFRHVIESIANQQ